MPGLDSIVMINRITSANLAQCVFSWLNITNAINSPRLDQQFFPAKKESPPGQWIPDPWNNNDDNDDNDNDSDYDNDENDRLNFKSRLKNPPTPFSGVQGV